MRPLFPGARRARGIACTGTNGGASPPRPRTTPAARLRLARGMRLMAADARLGVGGSGRPHRGDGPQRSCAPGGAVLAAACGRWHVPHSACIRIGTGSAWPPPPDDARAPNLGDRGRPVKNAWQVLPRPGAPCAGAVCSKRRRARCDTCCRPLRPQRIRALVGARGTRRRRGAWAGRPGRDQLCLVGVAAPGSCRRHGGLSSCGLWQVKQLFFFRAPRSVAHSSVCSFPWRDPHEARASSAPGACGLWQTCSPCVAPAREPRACPSPGVALHARRAWAEDPCVVAIDARFVLRGTARLAITRTRRAPRRRALRVGHCHGKEQTELVRDAPGRTERTGFAPACHKPRASADLRELPRRQRHSWSRPPAWPRLRPRAGHTERIAGRSAASVAPGLASRFGRASARRGELGRASVWSPGSALELSSKCCPGATSRASG